MSWQRIDENTYIDNTLVTCAEYQLFISEMREQGKYHEPDHWMSYQFPEGHARKPVLGVRHSDTVAFCEWLTQNGNGEWKYRLPTKEVAIFPIKLLGQSPLGYWIDENYRFASAGTVPYDGGTLPPKHVDYNREIESALTRARKSRRDYFAHKPIDAYHAVADALKATRESFIDIDRDLIRANDLGQAYDLVHVFDRNFKHNHEFNTYLDRALDLALNRAHNDELSIRNLALDLFFDIYILQERIAGRSPAFEGIRLVKERMR